MFKGLRKAEAAATSCLPGKTAITHTVLSLEKPKYCGTFIPNLLHSNLLGREKK